MTTDINGTVIGLQGNPVSSASPTDGYVLTWDAVDGYWVARPVVPSGLKKDYFTSNGTWTAPVGVTNIILIGAGGGGGGGSGNMHTVAGGGGGGSLQQTSCVSVIPGSTYTITIGSGGAGGTSGNSGSNGGSTTFKLGSTILFTALGANGGTGTSVYDNSQGGLCVSSGVSAAYTSSTGTYFVPSISAGSPDYSANANSRFPKGFSNPLGFTGGSSGTVNGGNGGGGGGGGPQGVGADGGNGTNSGNAGNGSSAIANTGAGGGGGGSAGDGGGAGGAGGTGGSGYLFIVY